MATSTTTHKKPKPKTLREILDERGLTQHSLSIATGIHSTTICRYVAGLEPTAEHKVAIDKALA